MDTCTVHVVIDSVRTGIAIGGLRLVSAASAEEASELARAMTDKLAAFGVEAGGAKVLVDRGSSGSFEDLSQDICTAVAPFLREGLLLGEDVGVTSDEVRELYIGAGLDPVANTLQIVRGQGIEVDTPSATLNDLLTGRFSGRLAGRGVAIALGAVPDLATEVAHPITVAIQGAGSVGGTTARILAETPGFTVVSLCDARTLVSAPDGFAPAWIEDHVDDHGNVDAGDVDAGMRVGLPKDWIGSDATVLVAAAVRDAVTAENVDRLSPTVRCVVEAANLAVTGDAAEALEARGITLIPASLSSAFTSVCFGLLATGQAGLDDVESVYRRRVETIMAGAR